MKLERIEIGDTIETNEERNKKIVQSREKGVSAKLCGQWILAGKSS